MNVSTTLYIDGARIEPTADGRGVMIDSGGDSLVVMLGFDDAEILDSIDRLRVVLGDLANDRTAVPA